MKKGNILVVDDNSNVRAALRILLNAHFEKVSLLSSPNQLPNVLREFSPDVVLLDMNFSAGINTGNEGLYWLGEIKKQDAELPVVLFTAYADVDLAVNALKKGAADFVVKPWDNAKLVATLRSAYSLRLSQKEVKRLREKQDVLTKDMNKEKNVCWGASAAMLKLKSMVEKVANTDANILITGENGTGKEVIAREIHRLSRRCNEVMISVDMGAITETLFESELFGCVKGAFTDAKTDRAGKFEAANGGTLFLDEIGNLSFSLQAKLLNVLQTRQVTRIGSVKAADIDIRLVCATNRNLEQSVEKETFREDLLYRINTIQIELPPLRKRIDDIELLTDFFLHIYGNKYNKQHLRPTKAAIDLLKQYAWPGNIRELQHSVEKAVILSEGNELEPSDFMLKKQNNHPSGKPECLTLDEAEKLVIKNALIRHKGNMSAVANELGITRPTLYNKIKKYGL